MKEIIELGSSPANEPCVQTTDPDYAVKALDECKRYKALIAEAYRAAHAGRECPARLYVKSNSHDFGKYYEVAVSYDPADRAQIEAAFWCDENAPTEWPETTAAAEAVFRGRHENPDTGRWE